MKIEPPLQIVSLPRQSRSWAAGPTQRLWYYAAQREQLISKLEQLTTNCARQALAIELDAFCASAPKWIRRV
jgi:hypothetical protein